MKHLIRIWGNVGDAICAEPFVREFIVRHSRDHVAVQSMAPSLYINYSGVHEAFHIEEAVTRKNYNRYWFAHPNYTSHISAYFEKYKEYKLKGQPPRFILPAAELKDFKISFRKTTICIAASAANPIRDWVIEKWEMLCGKLKENYTLVQLGQDEQPLQNIHHCLINRTTLPEAAEILRRSRLLISVDSGLSHLATAVGRRSVVLFGPVLPNMRLFEGFTIPVISNKCKDCWPTYKSFKRCPKGHHRCMEEITIDMVYEAVMKELSKKNI